MKLLLPLPVAMAALTKLQMRSLGSWAGLATLSTCKLLTTARPLKRMTRPSSVVRCTWGNGYRRRNSSLTFIKSNWRP